MGYLVGLVAIIFGGLVVLGLAIQAITAVLNWIRSLFNLPPMSTSEVRNSNIISESAKQNLTALKSQHQVALDKFIENMRGGSDTHYVDNKTMDFLRNELRGTGYSVGHEYYYRWSQKRDLPIEVKEFGKHVHSCIDAKYRQIQSEKRTQEEAKQRQDANSILTRYQDKVSKFLEVAYRKVSTVDEYGDENSEALNDEILRFLKKLSESENTLSKEIQWLDRKKTAMVFSSSLTPISNMISKELTKKFHEYYSSQKEKTSNADKSAIDNMTGIEFEQYLIQLLKKCNVTDASGTSATGDQGADVIFSFDGLRIVIQAKRYNTSVGNKAIQEVHAAKGFYNCDKAWVITNSTFTTSAKSLARQLDVHLVDGLDLERFQAKFEEYFSTLKTAAGS